MLLAENCDDVDVFEIQVEMGVEQLCWGVKKIASRLEGKIGEVAVDATCESSEQKAART
jgi:hypothetical protein